MLRTPSVSRRFEAISPLKRADLKETLKVAYNVAADRGKDTLGRTKTTGRPRKNKPSPKQDKVQPVVDALVKEGKPVPAATIAQSFRAERRLRASIPARRSV